MRRILPTILALLTGHDRYFPEFEWCENSWTVNVFRAYEAVFGRRFGIRAEMAATVEPDGTVTYRCFTLEASLALAEQMVRKFISSRKLAPFKIHIPILATRQGVPFFASPYLFAIAIDTGVTITNNWTGASTYTTSYTVTGSNPMIVASFESFSSTETQTSVTYNGVSLSLVGAVTLDSTSNFKNGGYFLPNCATGTHNVVHTKSSTGTGGGGIASYSGVATAATAEGATYGDHGATSNTISVAATSTSDNAWHIMFAASSGSTCTAGANTTLRNTTGTNLSTVSDSNSAKTPAGSVTLNIVDASGSVPMSGWIAAFAPYVAASGPANLKTYNTNAKANVKTMNTNAIANVKTFDTNA